MTAVRKEGTMDTRFVVIIQCDLAHRHCSGFACTNAFYNKEGAFKNYDQNTRYISFTCGGCCGKSVSAKLSHFTKKIYKHYKITQDQITVHLASCMVTDNYHYDRCPHIGYIKDIVAKRGFHNIVEGSYISANAATKRKAGIYKVY